jgi:predicted GNAT family N-acyltransferase
VSEVEVVVVRSEAEMRQALAVRRAVFIEEQAVPESLEVDEHDGDPVRVTTALHVLARAGAVPAATGRLLLASDQGNAHIGRVAVLAAYRGRGLGTAVMEALHVLARERGFTGITLAAQLHAIGFYERLGYAARGEVFLDAGIEHRWMDRSLA